MTKAFLYDSQTGMVYHALFTGVDRTGRAQWVKISPGEDASSFSEDYLRQDRLNVLSIDDKPVPSEYIAHVLMLRFRHDCMQLRNDLEYAINLMKEIGLEWNKAILNLNFRIGGVNDKSYYFEARTTDSRQFYIGGDYAFKTIEDILKCIRVYLIKLVMNAEIPVGFINIDVPKKIKDKFDKQILSDFSYVEYSKY